MRFLFKFAIGPLSNLNGFHVTTSIKLLLLCITQYLKIKTLSFAFLVCITLYIDGKQFR